MDAQSENGPRQRQSRASADGRGAAVRGQRTAGPKGAGNIAAGRRGCARACSATLQAIYEKRGVNLCCVAGKYQFRTASDLAFLLRKEQPEQKRLSKAAIETLAIIAYHQPVTRAEIEDIRGVAMSKGTIDTLMESAGSRSGAASAPPAAPSPMAPPRPSWSSSGWRA